MSSTDPFDLLKVKGNLQGEVKSLKTKLETTSRRNVSAGALDEITQDMGQMRIGGDVGVMTSTGLSLSTADMDVGFWASIGVPSTASTAVYAVCVSGTDVYYGGVFTRMGGIDTGYIAKYNTITGVWYKLGSTSAFNGAINTIAVSGSDVYVGGAFTNCDGIANADYVAKWNGSVWSAMGAASLNNTVQSIAISGSDVYVGGEFTNADGIANADYVAKWNGSAWSAMGAASLNTYVLSIFISGSDVYVGGAFANADGIADADYIAKWNGSAWSAVAGGMTSTVNDIYIYNGVVYVAGFMAGSYRVSKLDNGAWVGIGGSGDISGNSVKKVRVNDKGVFICGLFTIIADYPNTAYTAYHNGTSWVPLGVGLNGNCYAMEFVGNDLYFGGSFTEADGRASKGIAAYLQTLESVLVYLEIHSQALQDSIVTQTNPNTITPDGWKLVSDTWAYASASTITIPTDGTTVYQKGMKIRLKQGGGYKYYTVKTVTATLITVYVNTDYTVANSAITDVYYSYADKPFGFPDSFTFTSAVTYAGGTTDPTSNTVNNAEYSISGGVANVVIVSTLVRGTGNRTVTYFSTPFAPAFICAFSGTDTITASGAVSAVSCYLDTTNLVNYKQTMANNGAYRMNGIAYL